jgi:hypothetical protein
MVSRSDNYITGYVIRFKGITEAQFLIRYLDDTGFLFHS